MAAEKNSDKKRKEKGKQKGEVKKKTAVVGKERIWRGVWEKKLDW